MATPICRCRVLYLGSSVPHITKDGLQGIQEPLRELYPDEGIFGTHGIDSWLSVWSNGLLLENVDELGNRITRFFPVQTLHYCAAVRHVIVPGTDGERVQRFLPLDSPFARVPTATNPPLFACILRRTTGIKVLECHAFICKKEMAANALVRCCFHAYADNMYARQLEGNSNGGTEAALNGRSKYEYYEGFQDGDLASVYEGNRKVWGGSAGSSSPSPEKQSLIYGDGMASVSVRSGDSPTGKSGTTGRVRQMVLPSKPLPPGVEAISSNQTTMEKRKKKKGEDKQKKSQQNGRHYSQYQQSPVNGRFILPPGDARYYHGGDSRGGTPVYPPPPPLIAPNGRPLMITRSAEEPTYMPSARPLSPTASYQPMAFPYDRYYMHYNGMSTQPRPISANAHKSKPKKQHRKTGSASDKNSDGTDSKYSTGIYRKKGHLNERAFSYSIRQEHRSRSHNSLAALGFNGNGDSGKYASDRELAKMVGEMSLSDEDNSGRRSHGTVPKKSVNGKAGKKR